MPAARGTCPSVTYLLAPAVCRAVVEVTPLRIGRSASQVWTRLVQDGQTCVEALLTLGRLDPHAAPRWTEIKTHLGGAHLVLRSQHPDGAEQELYGFLLVHHAIRTLMHRAAREGDHDPDRISFTRSLRMARRQVTDYAAFSPRQTRPRRQSQPR